MSKFLNPNLLLTLIFFGFFRFIDASLIYKGILFIIVTITLIYLPQKPINKKSIFIILGIIIAFIFLN